jgi:hypothetical protein
MIRIVALIVPQSNQMRLSPQFKDEDDVPDAQCNKR